MKSVLVLLCSLVSVLVCEQRCWAEQDLAGRMLVSSWAGMISSGCGVLWKENDFWLLLMWGKARNLIVSLLCPRHLYKAKIIIDLLP